MNRSIHGADSFTWCRLTLHTSNWLWDHLGIVLVTFSGREITIHADPVHFTTHGDLLFANNRNIVFCLTSNQTRVAADAIIKINGHRPLLTLIVEVLVSLCFFMPSLTTLLLVKRDIFRRMRVHTLLFNTLDLRSKISFVTVMVMLHGGNFTSKCTAIHRVVLLGHGDGVTLISTFCLSACGEVRGLVSA